MKTIVAVSRGWGIGKAGGMLFRLPGDLRRFKEITTGKVVVMGRKTLLSFKDARPLPNRVNIVLTRDKAFAPEGVTVCHGLPELKEVLAPYAAEDVYVIGGAEIYRLLLPYCSTALVTHVDAEAEADTFFPHLLNEPGWRLADYPPPVEDNGYTLRFCEYTNARPQIL